VARINDHIITKRDLDIEHKLQEKIYGDEAISKTAVLNEMIDTYLVMVEIRKTLSNGLKDKVKARIAMDREDFESLFSPDEYDIFLNGLEITREDILLRFTNKVLVENYLKRKIQTKKNGSNIDKSMILDNDIKKMLSDYSREYIDKLRMEADRLMINDIE
jgi:hypothetical protein